MNKILAITVFVAFLALGAESFRVPRQAEDEKGTIAVVVDTLKSYYDQSVDTASGYVETIKGYKLEEKAKKKYIQLERQTGHHEDSSRADKQTRLSYPSLPFLLRKKSEATRMSSSRTHTTTAITTELEPPCFPSTEENQQQERVLVNGERAEEFWPDRKRKWHTEGERVC